MEQSWECGCECSEPTFLSLGSISRDRAIFALGSSSLGRLPLLEFTEAVIGALFCLANRGAEERSHTAGVAPITTMVMDVSLPPVRPLGTAALLLPHSAGPFFVVASMASENIEYLLAGSLRRPRGRLPAGMNHTTLSSGLLGLTFGDTFNQSLDHTNHPGGHLTLTFRLHFHQSMDHTTLPSGLQSLSFCDTYHMSQVNTTLPCGLLTIS